MPKVLWSTLPIRIAKPNKTVALQFRWPMEPEEFDQLISELHRRRYELTDEQPVMPPPSPSDVYVAKRMREG